MWRFENNCELHVGETIDTQDYTIPSLRFKYKIPNLKFEISITDPDICYVYSTTFPLVDVWHKYINNDDDDIYIIFKEKLEVSSDVDLWHIELKNSYAQLINNIDEFDPSKKPSFTSSVWSSFTKYMTKMNGKYTAVYVEKLPWVDVFENDQFCFRARHNMYNKKCTTTVVDLVNISDETYLFINDVHSCISFYNMQGTRVKRHEESDMFMTSFFIVKGTEVHQKPMVVIYGYVWSSVFYFKVYELERMFNEKNYKGIMFNWNGDYTEFPDDNTGKVCVYKDKMYTPYEATELKAIDERNKEGIRIKTIQNHWKNDNVLKDILSKHNVIIPESIEDLQCHGGKSNTRYEKYLRIIEPNLLVNVWGEEFPSYLGNEPLVDRLITIIFQNYVDNRRIIENGFNSQMDYTCNLVYTINTLDYVYDITIKVQNIYEKGLKDTDVITSVKQKKV
jgi:hypothetical protein